MTEIEKMYKLTKAKAINIAEYGSTYIPNSVKIDGELYPPFTAEKQLKIIQLLSKIRGDIQLCYSDNQYIFVVNFENAKCQWANKYHEKIDEALADMVNALWQDLTDQEKEEIRRILND